MALALLIVLPALARDSEVSTTSSGNDVELTISVHAGGATAASGDEATSTAKDTRVLNPGGGATVWVAANPLNTAYNQVLVELGGAGTTTLTDLAFGDVGGVAVTNRATARGLQVLRVDMGTDDLDTPDDTSDDVQSPLLESEKHSNLGAMSAREWALVDDNNDSSDGVDAVTDLTWVYEVASVALPDTDSDAVTFTGNFFVVDSERTFRKGTSTAAGKEVTTKITAGAVPATPAAIHFLVAGNNDEIRITASGSYTVTTSGDTAFSVSNSATLKVDARGPSITGTAPASGQTQNQISATFQATFTDSGSGLRDDSENPFDNETVTNQPPTSDGDSDDIKALEPLAKSNGAASDIILQVTVGGTGALVALESDGTFPVGDNKLSAATNNWRAVDNGFRFQFTDNSLLPSQQSAVVMYAFGAVDRVGNVSKKEKNRLIIDTQRPGMTSAEAGIGYTSRANDKATHEKRNDMPSLSAIKITFGGGVGDAAETLDPTSIEVADFKVETADAVNLPIAEIIHQSITSGTGNDKRTTNHILWLVLADPLGPGAKPTVSIVGTILDTAGNRLGAGAGAASSRRADDLTRPEFSVSITGSAADRVAATGRTTDTVGIRVTATEPLAATPDLYLVSFSYRDAKAAVKDNPDTDTDETAAEIKAAVIVDQVRETDLVLSSVAGLDNTWEETVDTLANGLWGVVVIGSDPDNNRGTTRGITLGDDKVPTQGDVVTDLSKMALFEVDTSLAALDDSNFVLTPSSGANKTQSGNPFIRIDFAEGNEYPIGGANVQHEVKIDTHGTVTLTKLQLQAAGEDPVDLLGTEGRVSGDSDSFLVSLSDLAVGKYTLIVNGEDDLGNSYLDDETYKFEVTQRAAYKVSLWPGNNLVSLPGDPVDPSIDAVLPASHPATAVLAYSPTDPVGPWLAATREAGGTWSGPLTEIRQGHGYWVDTSAFTPISTRLVERGSGEVPPTFALTQGWNLIGVVAASSDSIGDVTAAEYLASVNWSVAYTYDTSNNSWTKVTSGDKEAKLSPGQGVWVWLESADVLAP